MAPGYLRFDSLRWALLIFLLVRTPSLTSATVVNAYVSNAQSCEASLAALDDPARPFCDLVQVSAALNRTFTSPKVDVVVHFVPSMNPGLDSSSTAQFSVSGSFEVPAYSAQFSSVTLSGECPYGPCYLRCIVEGSILVTTGIAINATLSNLIVESCEGLNLATDPYIAPGFHLAIYNVLFLNPVGFPIFMDPHPTSGAMTYGSSLLISNTTVRNFYSPLYAFAESFVISDCVFETNYTLHNAAFRLYPTNATNTVTLELTIERSVFRNISTQAVAYGGVFSVQMSDPSPPVMVQIDSCLFSGNAAPDGAAGAFYYGGSNNNGYTMLNIYNSTFDSNTANGNGGAIYLGTASGLFTINIANCVFTNNKAISGNGGAVYVPVPANTTITNSTFQRNSAYLGAAIYVESALTISFTSVSQNTGYNSVVYISGSASISDSVLSHNTLTSNDASTLYFRLGSLDVQRTTISSNYAGGVAAVDTGYNFVVIASSYIWNNAGYALIANGTLVSVSIDASNQTSIYSNAWAIGGNTDILCVDLATSVTLAGGENACASICAPGLRDMCSECNGNSACLQGNCALPFSTCAAPALSTGASQVNYTGINPTLTTTSGTTNTISLEFYSLTDIAANGDTTRYLLEDVLYLSSQVIAVQGTQTAVNFDGVLPNGAKISFQQTLFGVGNTIYYAGTKFSVDDNTLKTTMTLADWPTNNTVRLSMTVNCNFPIKSIQSTTRETIIEDIMAYSKQSDVATLLAVSNVFVSNATNIPAKVAYTAQMDAMQVQIDFEGPIGVLEYDPDISVLVASDESGVGDGDGSPLVAILAPVLVGSAGICVCCVIILGVIFLVGSARYRRHKRALILSSSML